MSDDGDRHVAHRELEDLRSHIDERFDSHKEWVEEKFKAQFAKSMLAIGVAVGLLKFQIPDTVTVGAILAVCVKSILALIWRT